MTRSGTAYLRQPSAPLTSETGSLSLPTPSATSYGSNKGGGQSNDETAEVERAKGAGFDGDDHDGTRCCTTCSANEADGHTDDCEKVRAQGAGPTPTMEQIEAAIAQGKADRAATARAWGVSKALPTPTVDRRKP